MLCTPGTENLRHELDDAGEMERCELVGNKDMSWIL